MEGSSILSSLKVPPNYNVEEIVENEFRRTKGECYLDFASAALYSERQVQDAMQELSRSLLGNPHSRHPPSDTSTQSLEAARHRVLEHFNTTAEEYDLIFTAGATAALRVIAEYFKWNPGQQAPLGHSTAPTTTSEGEGDKAQQCKYNTKEGEASPTGVFVYVQENHTSVLGMRGPANEAGCDIYCLPTSKAIDLLKGNDKSPSECPSSISSSHITQSPSTPKETSSHTSQNEETQGQAKKRNCLFAYSGQCNYSGSKAPLEWIKEVQDGALNSFVSTPPINKDEATGSNSENKERTEENDWYVVLDAASLAATCPLDLTLWKPDFVAISFYKLFGYPSGLGGLLVRRRAWEMLERSYDGGGTILMIDSRKMISVPRPILHERFEDGTQSYLAIPMLRHGLDTIHRLTGGVHNISSHVFNLARYTHHTLRSMRHAQGTPVAQTYRALNDTWLITTHGAIVNFNLKNPDGSYVGFFQVERVASLYNICLRTGCLCNPGACQVYLGITPDKLINYFRAGHVCGDALDLIDGETTGSVRVSFGYSTTYEEVDQFLKMVRECFVEEPMTYDLTWMEGEVDLSWLRQEGETEKETKADVFCEGFNNTKIKRGKTSDTTNNNSNANDSSNNNSKSKNRRSSPSSTLRPKTSHPTPKSRPPKTDSTHTLTDIVVYPVKSCGGVRVESWSVGGRGLWMDRQWMVVSGGGATLTQKKVPRMALISPRFELESKELVLAYEGEDEELRIPLDPLEPLNTSGAALCGGRVCGVRVRGQDCGDAAGDWLSRMLWTPDLRLMMQISHRSGKLGKTTSAASGESLSLANESQYLVIHRPSVRSLLKEINSRGLDELTEDELVERFRGNLVVDGGEAYEEDNWDTLTINGTTLQVQGGCRRCQMVCVVPGSGHRTREPMLSLSTARGTSMLFGVHASALPTPEEEKRKLCVGAEVQVTLK